MDHNLKMFFLLFGLSYIPWAMAFFLDNREEQWGLLTIDFGLSVVAYWFLALAIGWWLLLVIAGLSILGMVFKRIGLYPYEYLS